MQIMYIEVKCVCLESGMSVAFGLGSITFAKTCHDGHGSSKISLLAIIIQLRTYAKLMLSGRKAARTPTFNFFQCMCYSNKSYDDGVIYIRIRRAVAETNTVREQRFIVRSLFRPTLLAFLVSQTIMSQDREYEERSTC